MTKKQAIEQIEKVLQMKIQNEKYFHLNRILSELEKVKIVYRDRIIFPEADLTEHIDYQQEAERVAKLYDITLAELKSEIREFKYVLARVHFCRHMRKKYANVTCKSLGTYINKHYTTVLHYLHHFKGDCPLEGIPTNPYERNN